MRQDNNDHESVFLGRLRRTLDDSADNLDARTLSQLTQARHRALEKAKSKPYLHRRPFWLSLAGLVTATAVVFLAIFLTRDPSGPQYYSAIEDVEILAASEHPEFFSELEFYAWLAEEMDDAG
jgi:negative regulator of sigma E activity